MELARIFFLNMGDSLIWKVSELNSFLMTLEQDMWMSLPNT